MTNERDERSTNMKTFRFGSGQILPLTDHVIHQIPYLLGLVSFAELSSTGFDDDGNIKLDPIIDFKHFCIIIDALPFQSVSQTLIHLPKHEDSVRIMMLIDYLGLLPMHNPSLDEIDSIFMLTLYEDERKKLRYRQVIEVDLIQNMAAHFAFGLVKNDYDHRDDKVISKIRWCNTFISKANKAFHPRLRYHVKKASEYYFRMFRPSLVRFLHPSKIGTETDKKKISSRVQKHSYVSSEYSYDQYEKNESSRARGTREDFMRSLKNRYRRREFSRPRKSPFESSPLHFNYYSSADIEHYWSKDSCSWSISEDDTFVYCMSTEIFDALKMEIWSKCVDNNPDELSVNVFRTGKR